ncbi:MAG: T9SS type A sorting domain-containing protein [Sphingobacteriaceae bacterium]|nr:T9SS type A sorting domain-containing protein [Sphingobacteriaceae bacterium]
MFPGSVFNPTTAGIGTHQLYYVYTNTNGCSNTAAATVSVTAPCTGINEIVSEEDAFTIFPNPSNGEFKITATKEMAVTITNELGQLVYTKQIKAANNYSVEVFGLSSGVYFIDNGAVRKKIVVVK